MEPFCRRITLALVLTLHLLMLLDSSDEMMRLVTMAGTAASSPLAGTKIRQPWVYPLTSAEPPGRRYIHSVFDFYRNPDLTKLLDVGACSETADNNSYSFVPPLDGTNPSHTHTLCQEIYGMRFVLLDLKLVNIDTVDSLSGSFTFQLVFHWVEGWEGVVGSLNESYSYQGDEIETADGASTCGFDCDTTAAVKTRCCDRMWVPPLQVPSFKVNDVQSVTPTPYLRTTYYGNQSSYWKDGGKAEYKHYSVRRTWYVGLDLTCPFSPEFRNFPFDHQFLTVDIINPYASRTWLQLNKGFLEANIVDSIAGIDLSPDGKIGGWAIEDVTVSNACGTQQTWQPTFLTQDYLLQILGDQYKSQKETIMAGLRDITCAKMKNLDLTNDMSLSNPSNRLPYNDTKNDYMERLNATILKYKECTTIKLTEFRWKDFLHNSLPDEVVEFNYSNSANMNRSFSFLDLEYPKAPSDGIDFQCLIDAIANLTTPGIRINIVIQRFQKYYMVKLFFPTCACVAFSFTSFALGIHDLLGRLTVIVPSAIALSALQGFVVATDIPVVAYIAPTTWIILLSYGVQLLIALECISFNIFSWIYLRFCNQGSTNQSMAHTPLAQANANADALATQEESLEAKKPQSRLNGARIFDLTFCVILVVMYVIFLFLLVMLPWKRARSQKKNYLASKDESLWN